MIRINAGPGIDARQLEPTIPADRAHPYKLCFKLYSAPDLVESATIFYILFKVTYTAFILWRNHNIYEKNKKYKEY